MTIEADTTENIEANDTAKAGATASQRDEYLERTIGENAKYRAKNAEYKAQIKELETQAQRAAALEEQVSTMTNAHRVEVAQARLEALAVKEGLIDSDLVKLIDTSELKFDEAGKPTNLAEVVNSFKTAKPQLFTAHSASTSSVAKVPVTDTAGPKDAMEMSPAEFARRRQELAK